MKVFIQIDKFRDGGTGTFRNRFIEALKKVKNIEVITNINDRFDIEIAFIRKVFKHKKPHILRVDGCYYNKKKIWNNKPIARAITRASHVVFQSIFAYKLCNQTLRIESRNLISRDKCSIIYNGINIDYINSIDTAKDIEPYSFVTCGLWNPNKRPYSTIMGFLRADTQKHLYVIGGGGLGGNNINKKYNSKYVHILGNISNERTISIMKACSYQIHLCHVDACPNVVIEGLSCGLKVLCSNLGGTRELVGKQGVILNIDKFWNTKYIKQNILDKVDKVKDKIIADGINKLMKIKIKQKQVFDINKTALEYVDILKKYVK